MSIFGWIIFGLITGWIASKLVNKSGEGCLVNTALGIVGAVVGGALFSALGTRIFWEFDLTSMLVAVLGAVIVLAIYHALTGRRGIR
jgi:uncharacterized membrane protein YeaQ/YmgE (transglycosylase-associated protein family)